MSATEIPRYRIVSTGGTTNGTKVIDIKTGEELKNVSRISIDTLEIDDVVTASVTLLGVELDIETKMLTINKEEQGDLESIPNVGR
jgi:hypothetical protein